MGARRRRPRTSTDCPHTPDAIAAGNLVADTIDGQPIDGWAAVVDALGDLHRRRVQPFTTQLLLDELHVLRGGDGVVAGTHPCDSVAAARLTQGEVVAGRPDTRFWVWEYPSARDLGRQWTLGEDGRATSRLACAAADGDYVANRNLVVEIPASSAPEPTRYARPDGLERALEFQPYTLGRIARAIDESGLDWRFYGDVRFPCFGPPGERAPDDAGLGVNASIGQPGSTDEESISPIVYVYRSPDGLRHEWDVESDGRASSERCTTFGVGWAAGNVVIAFDASWVPDPLGVWPRVGTVMQGLAEEADSSLSRS